jgi:hypothetical protein
MRTQQGFGSRRLFLGNLRRLGPTAAGQHQRPQYCDDFTHGWLLLLFVAVPTFYPPAAIRTLFTTFRQAIQERDWRILPPAYQTQIRDAAAGGGPSAEGQIVRSVADMIAEMTDEQAVRVFQRVTGHVPGSVRDLLLR